MPLDDIAGSEQLLVIVIPLLLGALLLVSAYRPLARARAAKRAEDSAGASSDGTVVGEVTVREPAEPDRSFPDHAAVESPAEPAVWAWRIRSPSPARNRTASYTWRTTDGGVAIGDFTVRDGWDDLEVVLPDATVFDAADDPFEGTALLLDEPAESVPVRPPAVWNRVLDRLGLAATMAGCPTGRSTPAPGGRRPSPTTTRPP